MEKAPIEYDIGYTPSAGRDIRKLKKNKIVLKSVLATISKLKKDPRPPGAEALEGDTTLRLRDGEYRIIYEVDDSHTTVTVTRVRDRKDAYKH